MASPEGSLLAPFHAEQAYVLKLVLSMIPIGFVGFLFKDRINALLDAPISS